MRFAVFEHPERRHQTPILGQQRRVKVDAAVRGHVQKFALENLVARNRHEQVGLERPEFL